MTPGEERELFALMDRRGMSPQEWLDCPFWALDVYRRRFGEAVSARGE